MSFTPPTDTPWDQCWDFDIISEHVDRFTPSAQITCYCNWTDRFDISTAIVGGMKSTDGDMSYVLPVKYPFGFDGENVCASSVDIVRLGDYEDGDTPDAQTAKLTVDFNLYNLLPYDQSNPITICQCTSNASGEQIPLPNGQYQWDTSGDPVDDTDFKPSKVFPTVELEIKVIYAAEPKLKDCSDLLGQLNQDDLIIPNAAGGTDTWVAQTVLFLSIGAETVGNSQGFLTYQRALKFAVRDNDTKGWNALWNPSVNEFDYVSSAPDLDGSGGGERPYVVGDFSPLFQIEGA